MAEPSFFASSQAILVKALQMGNKSKQHAEHGQNEDQCLAHRGWRIYVGVALMLIAMFVYLVTLDESVKPGGTVTEPVPKEAGRGENLRP